MRHQRSADPYRDTAVIDARAPRFNQATVGVVAALALFTGWWWLLGVLALQLVLGLAFGRRFCLPCVFYFEVVQPRIGEGEVEDSRPPRFANILGAVFLSLSTVAYATGATGLGAALAGLVAALALLAATTGPCVGCEIYRLFARIRGIRPGGVDEIDLSDLGVADGSRNGEIVVHFSHPLCNECHSLERRFTEEGRRLVRVDVSQRPDLARRYHVSIVPTAFAVTGDGRVLERVA